jgi:hypothetical protein
MNGWSWGGVAIAGLTLIALEVVVTSSNATGVLSLLQVPGQLAASWLSPAVPLIPGKSAGPSSSGSSPPTVKQSTVNIPAGVEGGVQAGVSQLQSGTLTKTS